jgi:hypothetical protein
MIEEDGLSLTLQTYIREVIGSNFGWDSGYPTGAFMFSSVLPGKCMGLVDRDRCVPRLSNSLIVLSTQSRILSLCEAVREYYR